MPRVTFVKSARKPRPEIGVEIGDSYYWWKFMRGPRMNSKTPPRPSQLTRSEFMGPYLEIFEAIEDMEPGDLEDGLPQAVSDLESLRDETQDKLDNMPEGLQEGDTGQLMQERIEAVEAAIDTLGDLVSRAEDGDFEGEDWEDLRQEALDADQGPG